jgi:hypothetical protein
MQLIIPTRGRTDRQFTLQALPPQLRKLTTIVCPKTEMIRLKCLDDDIDVIAQPDPTMTIAQKRKWIIEEWHRRGHEKILMLDDDLIFSTRISANGTRLRPIQGVELIREFARIEEKLSPACPHAGFGQRQGNNNVARGWKSPGRMMYSLGYFLPIVAKECELGRIETREDFDLSLQLLRKGYPNAIWNTTVADQHKYDAPGGVTNERTVESSNADALKLAELHPGYVTTVQKDYEASVPRIEVICRWKSALEDGLKYAKQ